MYILYNTISATTASDIRTQLEEKTGRRIYLRTTPHPIYPPIIRYGNHEGSYRNDTLYNSPEFIRMCCDKYATEMFFIQHNIYNTPNFSQEPPNSDILPFPVLIRTTLTGHGGVGMTVVNNLEEWNKHWMSYTYWWTPFINLSSEYRVLIFDGVPFKIFKKVRADGLEPDLYPIRNIDRGYHFSVRELDKFPNMMDYIQNHISTLLTTGFYGLDIGKIQDSEEFFVLELNSAPGMNINTSELLVDRLIEKLSL